MSKIIDSVAKCNINQYIECKYEGNLECLTIEGEPTRDELISAWAKIYNQYFELAGGEVAEFPLLKNIHNLDIRNETIRMLVNAQELSIEALGVPYEPHFHLFEQYRHTLKWNGDLEAFKRDLKKVVTKEKTWKVKLEEEKSSLNNLYLSKSKESVTDDSRPHFIQLLNRIVKFGFRIERDKTTLEEFALMFKDYKEACERVSKN